MKSLVCIALIVAAGAWQVTAQTAASAQAAPAQTPPPAAAPAATPDGSAETGRTLYNSYGCYQCHGFEAQGSSATGPRLGPRPLPLAVFVRFVRQPGGQMPGYGPRIVSDADLAHIHAFLQARPAPTPVQDIPLLLK